MTKLTLATAALLALAGLTACSSGTAPATTPAASAPSSAAPSSVASTAPTPSTGSAATPGAKLTTVNGTLTDTDKVPSVIDKAGLQITVMPGSKTAKFQTIDPASGAAFKDYFLFDYAAGTFTRHKLSERNNQEYDYVLDQTTKKLTSVKTGAEDAGPMLQKMGQWGTAEKTTADDMAKLESYFEQRYGTSLRQAAGA